MQDVGTSGKIRTPARMLARILDRLEDLFLLVFFLLCFLIGAYSVYDSYLVYQKANDTSVLKFKPGYEKEAEDAREITGNMVAWVEVQNTSIDYPVMQGASNTEYLNTDPYGDYSLSGSIFLDYRNSPDLSDGYLLIYGHHMERGSMFGALDAFADPTYLKAHQEGILYIGEVSHPFHIFAFLETYATDDRVFSPTVTEEAVTEAFVQEKASYYDQALRESYQGRLLALSTCKYPDTADRTVVFAILED